MKIKSLFYLLILVLFTSTSVMAHSGRTDSAGGHYNRSTGEYHYHHGYSAHQHPNGVCPYEEKNLAPSENVTTKQEKAESPSQPKFYSTTPKNNTGTTSSNLEISKSEQTSKISVELIILSSSILLLILYNAFVWIYNTLYGNAKAIVRNADRALKNTNKHYCELFAAMQRLNHFGCKEDAMQIHACSKAIIKELTSIESLFSNDALNKYISEDDRQMKFKNIKKEVAYLDELCAEIESKFYNKAQLTIPQTHIHSTNTTDIIFKMVKCRRLGSKGKYSICSAKIQRNKTEIINKNFFDEQIKHLEITEYVIIDFYFSNNHERKPVNLNTNNSFDTLTQKGCITSSKDGKTDVFEVILTDEDATSDYRSHQMIDTVRKVAKDEQLSAKAKKIVKGLKLSYTPPKHDK